MNIQDLNDDALLKATENLAKQEREILTEILHHLREVERRRLFSALKFKSLFEYAVKQLCYSEDQAYRRISAMRLLKDIPELEEKINSGSISLTNIGVAQSYFRNEQKITQRKFTQFEKAQVLAKLENKSSREAEKFVLEISSQPETLSPDRIRPLGSNLSEVRFTADQALLDKIEKLKGLLAHQLPEASMLEIFHKVCDLGLEKLSPAAPQKRCIKNPNIKKLVWRRDQAECQNCKSTFALQVDHRIPKAKGGRDQIENLRLMCRSCNQRSAIEHFGVTKIDKFLSPE